MNQLDSATQSNSISAEESTQGSGELMDQAVGLQAVVDRLDGYMGVEKEAKEDLPLRGLPRPVQQFSAPETLSIEDDADDLQVVDQEASAPMSSSPEAPRLVVVSSTEPGSAKTLIPFDDDEVAEDLPSSQPVTLRHTPLQQAAGAEELSRDSSEGKRAPLKRSQADPISRLPGGHGSFEGF
jgi:hypothetical protein